MSDIYKEKEWNIRKTMEEVPNIPYAFEEYVNEVDDFIDKLTKDLIRERDKTERLHSIIKEAKDFIANNSTISGTFDKNGKMIVESIEEIHNGMRLFDILDKAGSDKE